jgi:hypothetical protein
VGKRTVRIRCERHCHAILLIAVETRLVQVEPVLEVPACLHALLKESAPHLHVGTPAALRGLTQPVIPIHPALVRVCDVRV